MTAFTSRNCGPMLLFPLVHALVGASVMSLAIYLCGARLPAKRTATALVAVAVLSVTAPAGAQQSEGDADPLREEGLLQLDDIEAGILLFESTEPGWYVPAPTLDTTMDVTVSGPLARVTVSQRFRNVADIFVDGKYVFPLPVGSAGRHLAHASGRSLDRRVDRRTRRSTSDLRRSE